MRIKSIYIENFKAFKKVQIDCHDSINFFVGENNVGKSTILEAIQLWKIGYDCLLKANGREFYGVTTPRYLPVVNLFFLRISDINDIFHESGKKKLRIELEFQIEDLTSKVKIEFDKPSMIDAYLRVKLISPNRIWLQEQLSLRGLNLRNGIFMFQSRPVFYSIKEEPFYNSAQMKKKITLGKSSDVLRNKILRCKHIENNFEKIENHLRNVLKKDYKIKFEGNQDNDEFIKILVQEEDKKPVDLALCGSGLLQILEIFSTLSMVDSAPNSLNIILIDEPDSHIHSNLQSALIDELRLIPENQVFIITHNERLLGKALEGELFYINQHAINSGNVTHTPTQSYSTIATDLAGQLLDTTNNNPNKIIVITEGKTDKKILEVGWSKLYPNDEPPFIFLASGLEPNENKRSGNADTVRRTIEMISTIDRNLKIIGLFDNDREGNEQYKSASKLIFEEYDINNVQRKHNEQEIYALLLIQPDFRDLFVTENNILQRYFCIEHYFENEVLERHNMKGDNILGSEVFPIIGNKNQFSIDIQNLDANDFRHFEILFDKMKNLFDTE